VNGSIEDGERGAEIVVRVRDNGIGVPGDKRTALFKRFFRAHEDLSDAEGTGLGLSIVREAVEAIGGRAWAEFPEKGSVFAFALPYRRTGSPDRRDDSDGNGQPRV
jgi:signal transduction histidine kinase